MAPSPAERESLRLFLALWPDAHTRQQLHAWQAAQTWPADARLTHAADLHLTLHFLGQVPEKRLADLLLALPPAPHPIDLQLQQLQVWPNQVAVLTLERVPEPLLQLHAALGAVLDQLGLPRETRPYQPHVTLARRAHGLQAVPRPPLRWQAQGYVLALSERGYHRLQHYHAPTVTADQR